MRVSRTISISPFAPLTPTPLKTSRDTLHPPLCRCGDISPKGEKVGNVPNDFALRGAFGGWDYEWVRWVTTGYCPFGSSPFKLRV